MDYFKGFQVEYSLYFKHKICKNNKKWEIVMEEEFKIKSMLVRTFLAIVICLAMFFFKFILKEENFVEEVYKYLASDIVFLK